MKSAIVAGWKIAALIDEWAIDLNINEQTL